MKKKGKNAAYTLAFLDVLSNAMAAVLIITMVKMKPNPIGDYSPGLYSITIEHLEKREGQNLGLTIKLKDGQYLHTAEQMSREAFRIIKYDHNAVKLLFFDEPKQDELEEIICYVVDPIPLENEKVRIIVKLPTTEYVKTEILRADSQYQYNILNDTPKIQ